jgi:signal transduction histidine kinase
VRSLLTYARESPGQVASHNLNEIVNDTLLLTEHQLKTWSNISVLSDLGRNLPPLSCERTQIVQVLINLLTNARDAMPNGGKITIRTRYNAEHNRFKLQVSDTGTGIPKEMQTKIFDPFFTTKPVDQGTGLGLSIVLGIVKSHGGDIKVESAPKQGTTFTIYLPKEPIQKPDSEPLAENRGRY